MEEKKLNFQKLTPYQNADIGVYEEAIDFVFSNDDLRNVAISGSYGAGKSSIIESYEKHNNKRNRFVHLSLAHFQSPEQEASQSSGYNKESVMEWKVLNQLIHHIPNDKIPQTNFKVKKQIETKQIVKTTIFLLGILFPLIHLLLFQAWKIFVDSLSIHWLRSILTISTQDYSQIFSGLLFIVFSVSSLYFIVRTQKNKNFFRKINFQGTEIEFSSESNDSFFDRYLNEVLYLFENVDADVIVFEDMDRFNANRIFEQLREINTLANIKRKKVLRFFYLLRDDIFMSKDRTKFFDFIIPVVPVIDSSNSYDMFRDLFQKGDTLKLFDEGFLQGISLYVDEMRILYNIYNEFLVYYNKLNTTDLDSNKMLGIIVYKNLFPRDFNDLQLNRGFIYTVFNQKNDYSENAIAKYRKLRDEKVQEIDDAQNVYQTSIQDLDDLYEMKLQKANSQPDRNLRNQKIQEYNNEKKNVYPKQKTNIERVLKFGIPKLKDDLSKIDYEIELLQNKILTSLITRENIDSMFSSVISKNAIGNISKFEDIKSSDYFDLLKYLLREGYIDETYQDYMTYFRENSMRRVDKIFLRSIMNKKTLGFTYELNNPEKVIISDFIHSTHFDEPEMLNFDILECLLKLRNDNYLYRLLNQIKRNENYQFVSEYIDTKRRLDTFISYLYHWWPEFLSACIEKKAISADRIQLFSIYCLYYANDEDLENVNTNKFLTEYISNSSGYLAIENPNIEKLIDRFISLGVSFMRIDIINTNKNLLTAVYEKSLYHLNFENISLMLREMYHIINENEIMQRNYSLVSTKPLSPLAVYVEINFEMYMTINIANCGSQIMDEEDSAIKILNNRKIKLEQKQSYIAKLKTVLSKLNVVFGTALWVDLVIKDLVAYTIENIITYFADKTTLDNALVGFINRGSSMLNFSSVKIDYEENVCKRLFDAVIVANELDNHRYLEILNGLDYYCTEFNFVGISEEKLRILIDTSIVKMSADTLPFIRINYPKQTMYYISKNLQEYLKLINPTLYDHKETLELLTWNLTDIEKTNLISLSNVPISIIGMKYSDSVNAHILTFNLQNSDLPELFSSYERWGDMTKAIIITKAIQQANSNGELPKNVSNMLLSALFVTMEIPRHRKISIFNAELSNMDDEQCKMHLDELDLYDLKTVFIKNGRSKKVPNNAEYKSVLDAMKDYDLITGYDIDGDAQGKLIIKRKSFLSILVS